MPKVAIVRFMSAIHTWQNKLSEEQTGRWLALGVGSIVVIIWTVFRHITNGVNFDVVGQIGIADQWAHGVHESVTLGQTNYVLKMPLYMLANAAHFLSPMNRLLFFALIFNLATFIGIFVLIEKILDLEAVADRKWFYVAAVWFATISGGVFWMDYANSRNLETVGGLWLTYMVLVYLRTTRWKTLVWLAAVGAVIGFADPLQIYIFGGGALLYVAYAVMRAGLMRRTSRTMRTMDLRPLGDVLLAFGAAFVGSKILSLVTHKLLHINYLAVPRAPAPVGWAAVGHGLQVIAINTLKIFDADIFKSNLGLNSLRHLINLVILLGLVGLLVKYFAYSYRRSGPQIAGALVSIIAASYAVYIASGQLLTPNTSRYLIMVPIMTLVLVAVSLPRATIPIKWQVLARSAWGAMAVISALVLLGGVIKSWPESHAKDQHIYQTISFLEAHSYPYALGWHDMGVTTTYFAERRTVVLPVSCTAIHGNRHLKKISLFYDTGEFTRFKNYAGDVPFIVTPDTRAAEHCDAATLTAMFGPPKNEIPVAGVGVAEIYNITSLKSAL